ncbi:hypothetical protein ACQKQD_16150 [Methylobacterium sp. NPDC080182]|uniref:hypothetical protein n=1 Tax=Methylobacterium sp. NPDC080182 TaxID=3390590 RepID=UPI003CFF9FFB
MCGLAPLAVAVALSGPMCPRLDQGASPVMVALVGSGEVASDSRVVDAQFEASIRAIRAPAPKPAKRRRRR